MDQTRLVQHYASNISADTKPTTIECFEFLSIFDYYRNLLKLVLFNTLT